MQMLNDRNFNLSMEIRESFKNQKKLFQVERGKRSKCVHLKCDPKLFVDSETQMKLFRVGQFGGTEKIKRKKIEETSITPMKIN